MEDDQRPEHNTLAPAQDMFGDAIRHHQAGHLQDAERLYRQILAATPNNVAVLNNLGLISPPALAEALFRQATLLNPFYADPHINLGAVLRTQGRLDEAIFHYQQALRLKPTEPQLYILLGNIFKAQGKIHEAIAQHQQAIQLIPNSAEASFNLAALFQSTGTFAEALKYYQKTLDLQPNHPEALFCIGILFHAQGQWENAVSWYRQMLAEKPDHVETLNNLALVFYNQGKFAEAIPLLERALALRPNYAEAHNNLGDVYKSQGILDKAGIHYNHALRLKPDYITALCNLGIVFAMAGQFTEAAEWFRRTLALDPLHEVANRNLATALERDGRLAEAQIYRGRLPRPQPLAIDQAPDARRTVLVLWAAGTGNVPHETLLPRQINTRIKWYVECATDEQEHNLPPYDVVFNAIGNADLAGLSLPRLTQFFGHCSKPVLNRPERVPPTRRDLMPQLLAGIPNVVVPPVLRLLRADVTNNLEEKLAAGGLHCPVLVRPISGQGGLGLVLAETPEQLATLSFSQADAFYFISYHDYRNQDGYFRKYRSIFVDRKPYPYHLAISPRWLVHYFSAEMLAEPWKREEERRFLEDPEAALGPVAAAAIAAIAQRMDMEFAGIDYSVLPDGRVLVFEANATMSVILPDAGEFPYKQAPVKAIFAAFEDMLEARCRLAADNSSTPSPR